MTLMTIKDVCEYLQIKRATFYNYKKNGLPVHYANGSGGKPFCYKEEIDKWLRGEK